MSYISKDIFLRAKFGSEEAWRVIVENYTKSAYNIAYRMTYNSTTAEDLTQDIFLTLYKNINSYDVECPFEPWFYRMASNVCLNHIKKRKSELKADRQAKQFVSDNVEPDADIILYKALNELPSEYKMAIILKYLEHQSVDEIAKQMAVPIGTVKTWLFRARNILKEKLSKYVEI